MGSTPALPSLLIFGHQSELPSEQELTQLRQELLRNPLLHSLRAAINDLPQFWKALAEFDPTLVQIPGAKYLNDLQQWLSNGGSFPHRTTSPLNAYALPVTVILQITQYVGYLSRLELKEAHRHVLDEIKDGGAQGFCVGLLSALAVATAGSEFDIGAIASSSVRLAVCIGAYVDKDKELGTNPGDIACAAIRWRDDDMNGKDDVVALVRGFEDVGRAASNSHDYANMAVHRPTSQVSMI